METAENTFSSRGKGSSWTTPGGSPNISTMKLLTPLQAAAMLVLVSPSFCPAEDGMMVPVSRPEKAGLKRNLSMEVENNLKMVLTVDGEAIQDQNESWKASIELTKITDKVDEKGHATEVTLEIKRLSLTEEGETSEPLEKGSIVKASSIDGEETFTVGGEPVEEDAKKVLDMIVELANKSKGDENKAFGVDQPRKAGEVWEVNVKELIATLPDDIPFVIKEDATKGKMKFLEITGTGDQKLATIQGEVEMAITGMREMPPGFQSEASSIRVALDGQFPLDVEKQSVREGMSMIVDFKGKFAMPDGKKAEMKTSAAMILKCKEL